MNAIEILRRGLRGSEAWMLSLVDDVKDAPLTPPTANGGNHPMWIMGHLAFAEARFHTFINGGEHAFGEWAQMFGRGTEPHGDAAQYPPFEEVVRRFCEARAKTLDILDTLSEADLDRACHSFPPGREEAFGTVGAVLLTASLHVSMHIGQVADVRRALGRRPING